MVSAPSQRSLPAVLTRKQPRGCPPKPIRALLGLAECPAPAAVCHGPCCYRVQHAKVPRAWMVVLGLQDSPQKLPCPVCSGDGEQQFPLPAHAPCSVLQAGAAGWSLLRNQECVLCPGASHSLLLPSGFQCEADCWLLGDTEAHKGWQAALLKAQHREAQGKLK